MSRRRVAQRKFVPALAIAASAGLVSLMGSASYAQTVGNWVGPTSSAWSNPSSWQDNLIPNGVGHTAQYTPGGSMIALNDIANVTVGTLRVTGTGTNSMQFTPNQVIVMNQDGAGPGRAQWINDMQLTNPGANTNSALFLNAAQAGNPGYWVLQDDLFISNTSNTTRTSGSIQIRGPITGAGNIWVENVTNNISAGQIAFTNNQSTGVGGFGGQVTIAKGAATFGRGDVFTPGSGNSVTVGAAGMGDATLVFVGSGLGAMENPIIAAANTGGTSVFGGRSDGAVTFKSTFTNAGELRLNGNLSVTNISATNALLTLGNRITSVGTLTKIGAGPMRISNTNTFEGGLIVDAGNVAVGHADAVVTPFGTHDPTDGTLGTGDVNVRGVGTRLEIESGVAAFSVIANTAALSVTDKVLLGAGVNETIGGLSLGGVAQTVNGTYGSTSSGATFQNDTYFQGTGVVTLALGRSMYWDANASTAGAGGATPSGAWDGNNANFNSDSTGGAAGSRGASPIGTDAVIFSAGTDATGSYTVTVSGAQQAASLQFARGNVTLAGSGSINTPSITVDGGAGATLGSALGVNNGLTVTVNAGGTLRTQTGRTPALDVATLSVAATGKLDLNDGGLVKRNGGAGAAGKAATQQITALLKTGLENGGNFDWLGNGISSTEANADNATAGSVLYGLGVVQNNLASAGAPDGTTTDETPGNTIYTTFKGQTVGLNDTLVRYTYMGDADLDGAITGTDYSLIDAGFGSGSSGWINGDFDYSGSIDGTDYALIDNAFGAQTGVLPEQFQAMVAEHAALFGQSYVDALAAVQSGVVPEPATLGVLALAGVGLLGRRRRN